MKNLEDQMEILCPYCGLTQDDSEYRFVTYHGDKGWRRTECQDCGRKFEVEEVVARSYNVRGLPDENEPDEEPDHHEQGFI